MKARRPIRIDKFAGPPRTEGPDSPPRTLVLAEVAVDIRAADQYARLHGHHGELVRQHYIKVDRRNAKLNGG